ncbi:7-carboxy-7-deazaguanine synthase QueE [Chitinimonas arctica]|uniref:7-carboxy-7-deazaguanine synthase n=1 Tax=Chitinimonas arctica TaxID=2594795 RepID=A0A516SFG0_9NEIS|nr:7-carboxy-7-deazaguanine synthase QueE [Chitinimonas arctica]QDQ26896.1 7-carboxy-7-deazaguanine synthase QueE [Chitinimonas arctica]
MSATRLRITEIFFSLQGETSRLGLPTVFVRLTGCPLRCGYCDSAYAFHGGKLQSLDDIVAEVASHGTPYVCVTGGEPLAQAACHDLLRRLCDDGFSVSLETSGHLPIETVDPRVSRIVDIKTPGSGEVEKNLWENLPHLNARDELKFVLVHRHDYEWARDLLLDNGLHTLCPVLFSPVWESLKPADLAQWVLADKLPVRVQVQLHKILWGDKPGV